MKVRLMVLMEALVHQKKKLSINFSKANTKLCLSLHYNGDNSYLFVNEKEIFKVKDDNKNVNIPTQFYLRSISNKFGATESREVSLIEMCIIFQLITTLWTNKSDILNIHKCLTVKNNIK